MANSERLPIPNLFAEEDAKRIVKDTPNWENTLGFLAELTFPVDTNNTVPTSSKTWHPPVEPWDSPERYGRRLEIFSRYAGLNESMDDVGQKFGVTRQAVKEMVTKTLRKLHKDAPFTLRIKYPIKSLSTDKRTTIEASMRKSRKRGGKSYKVAEAVMLGKSVKEIKEEIGDISWTRNVLKGWGLELPFTRESILERFYSLGNIVLTSEEVQTLLDKVNTGRQFRTLQKAGLIVNLSSVARGAGLYVSSRDISCIYEVLNQEKIPVRTILVEAKAADDNREVLGSYNFVAAIHKEKAAAILKSSPELANLRINPVSILAGLNHGRIPNTTELHALKDYERVGTLIGAVRGKKHRNYVRIKLSDILDGSPVPVYRWNRHNFYAKGQREQFADFISRRLAKLGLL